MNVLRRFRSQIVFLLIMIVVPASGNATSPVTEAAPNDVERPASVTATIGDVLVRIDGPKLWTLSRIEYQAAILGIEDSAYGTVINIKDVGFIGTAHREVEAEEVTDLRFFLDDQPLQFSETDVSGKSFKVQRKSRIRSFHLDSLLELRDNRLYQSVRLRTASAVELKVMYPFMYAWTPTATAFLYGADDGTRVEGKFLGVTAKLKQFDQDGMNWLAVYDRPSGKGVVSRVLARPKVGDSGMRIVDAPGVYRKFYIMCFAEDKVPAGFDETYRIVTGYFESEQATWKMSANKLAEELRNSE